MSGGRIRSQRQALPQRDRILNARAYATMTGAGTLSPGYRPKLERGFRSEYLGQPPGGNHDETGRNMNCGSVRKTEWLEIGPCYDPAECC